MRINFNKQTLYTLIIGICLGVITILVTLVSTGGVPWLRAAGQGTGAADVNARFWNGSDWNSSITLTGTNTMTGTTTLDWSKTNVPPGMIGMFATSCPSGWSRLTELDGRFMAGGSSYATSVGGQATTTLTIANMPAHDHGGATGGAGKTAANQGYGSTYTGGVGGAHAHTIATAGEDTPFTNLPPYATVVFCTKN